MSDNLKAQSIDGFSWSLLGQVFNQLLNFIISVVLARLLGPEAFGLIGIIMGITAVLNVIQDFGLGSALIQKDKIDRFDFSSIFFFNLLVGIGLFSALYGSSNFIANFFKEEQLAFLVELSAIGLIFGSMSSSLQSALVKELNFKKLTFVGLICNILSGSLGLFLAFEGFGVISLVIKSLSNSFLNMLFYYLISPLKPHFYFSFNRLKNFFSFGSNVMGINIVARFFEQLDVLIIGRFYNPASVGFYNRAKSMKVLPILTLTVVMNKVLFPVYSKIKNDDLRLGKYFSFSIGMLSVVYVPIMLLISFYAREIIILLLTDLWAETIAYLQILCITGFFMPISSVCNNILLARGRAGFSFKYILVKRTFYTIALLSAAPFGVMSFVIVNALYAGVTGLTDIYFASKEIGLSLTYLVKKILFQIIIAVFGLLVIWALDLLIGDYYFLNLVSGIVIFGVVFIAINHKSGNKDWQELMEFIQPYYFKLRNQLKG